MRQGLTAYEATGAAIWRPYFLAMLAEGYGQVGAADEGLRVLAEALAAVQATGEQVWEAELHRLTGELLLMQQTGRPGTPTTSPDAASVAVAAPSVTPEAEASFRRLSTLPATSRPGLWSSAPPRAWRGCGSSRASAPTPTELLAEIYGWFTEGFDTADLQEARALLDALC